jgi:hypothetical protein
MTAITDEFMMQMLSKVKEYTLLILKTGPKAHTEGADKIIWEHGRRNFALRSKGKLSIVSPVNSNNDLEGIGIFNTSMEETKEIMDEDPAVKAGILIYELYSCRSFPGDSLPA